ncbi:MAG: pyrroline-5-carboxylate reductase [Flavobacteriia bacterium]|nr:pyrroline-5-carboxylate reductase [Flavobacteriia bacterium]
MKHSIGIIGIGNIGSSILNGLLNSDNIHPSQLHIHTRNISNLSCWETYSVNIISDKKLLFEKCSIIIIAVKPYQLKDLLKEINNYINIDKHIIISAVSGINIEDYFLYINNKTPLFRIMPNTAADVGSSVTCLSYNKNKKVNEVKDLLLNLGEIIEIEESLMNAATVLGACGIAFVFRFIRAMVQGGIQIGFDSKTAEKVVQQVLIGAVNLLRENASHPEQEIDKVTTPKGCTIVGLNEMEHQGFSSSLIKGIEMSYKSLS